MDDKLQALREAIDSALTAIEDSRTQVEDIARSTWEEVQRLEREYIAVRDECANSIEQVEKTERDSRVARERLMVVSRDVNKYTEEDMRKAYELANRLQLELGQWREREVQLRGRRDDIARRLKALRITSEKAEQITEKFHQTTEYLRFDLRDMYSTLQHAELQSTLGMQMLQLMEDERRNLATRLHDGPMQSLVSVGLRVQPLGTKGDSAQEIRAQLNRVVSDLRQVVFDLRPPLLDDLGLVPTVRRYASQWTDINGIPVQIQLLGLEFPLSPTQKVTVFRAIQESLKNIAMHSKASKVRVVLGYAESELTVQVLDDGIGVDHVNWTEWVSQGKLGLTIAKQRLVTFDGTLDIQREGQQGTAVRITLPVRQGGGNSS